MFITIVATKENQTSETKVELENNQYKGFIIKVFVHDAQNKTACIGILWGMKRRTELN